MKKRFSLLLLVFSFLISASLLQELFTVKVEAQLAEFIGAQRVPIIAVDRKNALYLAMAAATNPPEAGTPGSQIFFTVSRDRGVTWDNLPITKNLSKSKGEAFDPSIAITPVGTIRTYVVFQDQPRGGRSDIFVLRSKKNVKFNRKPFSISPPTGNGFAPRAVVDPSENVYITWFETSTGVPRVVFSRSTDTGLTFSPAVDISLSTGAALEPEIALDPSNNINLVWEDSGSGESQVVFSRSTDGGSTFTQPKIVSTGQQKATEAHIAIDSLGRIFVTWIGWNNGDLQAYVARSLDNGTTFSSPVNVSFNNEGRTHKPFVAVRGDTVSIAFQNGDVFFSGSVQRRSQVYIVRSVDGGLTFGESDQVSDADNSRGRAHSPAMVFDNNGRLHVVWIDSTQLRLDEGLVYYSSTDNGRAFTTQKVLVAAFNED